MIQVTNDLYVNKSKIEKLYKRNGEYYLVFTTGVKIRISKSLYDQLVGA